MVELNIILGIALLVLTILSYLSIKKLLLGLESLAQLMLKVYELAMKGDKSEIEPETTETNSSPPAPEDSKETAAVVTKTKNKKTPPKKKAAPKKKKTE